VRHRTYLDPVYHAFSVSHTSECSTGVSKVSGNIVFDKDFDNFLITFSIKKLVFDGHITAHTLYELFLPNYSNRKHFFHSVLCDVLFCNV
jgi:hypothetical protein